MKILHFADSHLGVEIFGRPDPATGLSTRLLDFTRALDLIADVALNERVDLVVFAGDAYRSREPNPTHQREFARRILRITQGGIPVYLLAGNHDISTAAGRATSVDIFETLQVPNVTVGREPRLDVVQTRSGPVQVVGVPWISRQRLFTREDLRRLSSDEQDQFIVDRITQFVGDAAQQLKPDAPAVLVAHLTTLGARFGSERSITIGNDPVVPISALALRQFSYVALGHIHRHQSMGEDPPVVYAGSIERVDFGEAGEEKGYVMVEITDGRTDWRFRPLPGRSFITIEVKIEESRKSAVTDDPTSQVLAAISRQDIHGAVVRVQLELSPAAELQLDYQAIRRALAVAHYNAGVHRRLTGDPRVRIGATNVEELTPLEALDLYLRSRNTPEAHKSALLERARQLLGEAR